MELRHIIFCVIIALPFANASCSSGKNVTDEYTQKVSDFPCMEYGISDGNIFRATANSTSSTISLAHEKAIVAAKAILGNAIIEKVTKTAQNYIEEIGLPNNAAFINNVKTIANRAVDNTLGNKLLICEKYSETNSRYTAYVAMEIDIQTVIEEFSRLAAKSLPDIDVEKFKKFLLDNR